ncbi:TylF/MycF/NovP-related O-methyltransferase [Qipengyuania qiaonensis]|uniref:TylF/MycF/NovP-related O-methyltransferase n=1 Tax=Qipengyuania qiaonensis TaxID=2867240 RepID=UPI0031F1B324
MLSNLHSAESVGTASPSPLAPIATSFAGKTLVKRPKRLVRQLNRLAGTRGILDANALNRFSGWAVSRGDKDVLIEAWIDGKQVASTKTGGERPDVERLLPSYRRGRFSGFTLEVPASAIAQDRVVDVKITARPDGSLAPKAWLATATLAGDRLVEKLASAPRTGIIGPFPGPVIDVVAVFKPEAVEELSTVSGQKRFIAALREILIVPALRETPAIADYVRYLQAIASHFSFVDRFFPTANKQARAGSADFHGKPNSVPEIMAIAHQLYVLKSYGVKGDFAEFGCFKGFSSSMLSFACEQLGVKMHIFDSFEGLPEAKHSGYTAGDYAGSLDEVTENVRRLGSVEQVTFHKGFYADTFRDYRPPQLMCLWMDVDLEVSAKDLMVVADKLDPRASLFSHECVADMFADGEIVTAPQPDNPIPPVLDRFEQLGRPLTGHHVHGHTGAFWPRSGGVPVLHHDALTRLLQILQKEVFK